MAENNTEGNATSQNNKNNSAALILGLMVIFSLAGFVAYYGWSKLVAGGDQSPPPPSATLPTELLFQNGISPPATDSEWWSARSDHRLLVQSLFACKALQAGALDNISRASFSGLLLDLTPSGNHVFVIKSGDAEPSKPTIIPTLTSTDQAFLSISDSIARARLAAAEVASANVPFARTLGLTALIVSALTTLFVTLQSRMKPVEIEPTKKFRVSTGWWWRRSADPTEKTFGELSFGRRSYYLLFGYGSGYRWVATLALILSIIATTLTGLKQIYDPTRMLTQNTRALVALRQLHQDEILAIQCGESSAKPLANEEIWASNIRKIRSTIVPNYGAFV
jgi:hypothetical protein